MNFQQLKIVRETVKQNFNLTDVGKILCTTQSGISKGLRDFEVELGIEIFIRTGKRLTGLTQGGRELLAVVDKLLNDAENIKRISQQFSSRQKGNLTIATTHTQARYVLPEIIKRFVLDFPDVHLSLHQGSPREIAELLKSGDADIGIATEALADVPELISFPCFNWEHGVVVPKEHPLVNKTSLTLECLAEFPIITYNPSFTGRSHVDTAFKMANLSPDIVITAMDTDVIKTYVELGLGVGVISSLAYNAERDVNLSMIPAGHLFGENFTRVAFKRGVFLRDYAYSFIQRISPDIDFKSLKEII